MIDSGELSDYGPCSAWTFDDACVTLPPEATPELIAAKLWEATILLWGASGRRVGPCPVTIRPCLDTCPDGGSAGPYKGSDGAWRNRGCGCLGSCACTSLSRVWLPGPVDSVTLVTVDGIEIPAEDWATTLEDGLTYLYRLDGVPWPSCSDPHIPCDEVGSFCVTYLRGLPLDAIAINAVSELTGELVRACIPNCPCRLPRNMQQMTRQGVTITFDTNQTWLRALPAVALFLDLRNPKGLTRSPSVWSPEVAPLRQ